jgi:hypothetical protein
MAATWVEHVPLQSVPAPRTNPSALVVIASVTGRLLVSVAALPHARAKAAAM